MTELGVTAFRGVLEGLKLETLLYYESLDGPGRFGMIVPRTRATRERSDDFELYQLKSG